MTIETIDRTSLGIIGERTIAALKDLGDELGITFSFEGAGRYGGDTGEIRISLAVVTSEGAESAAALVFKRYATTWGMTPDDLGAEVLIRGTRYAITGANANARKNPIALKRLSDGASLRGPLSMVKAGLKAAADRAAAEAAARKPTPVPTPVTPPTSAPVEEEDETFVAPRKPVGQTSTAPTFNSGSPFV